MIHIKDNQCPICLTEELKWNIDICKSDMQMFKCGHGTCKTCYTNLIKTQEEFSCPCCRGREQLHMVAFCSQEKGKWTTFAEWFNEYEIFIKSGSANNIVQNTNFGKQLLRLMKEARINNKKKKKLSSI